MKKIEGFPRNISELLNEKRYVLDFYQREFKWERKHIEELIDDLESKFIESYDPSHDLLKVAEYSHYYLGSIVVSQRTGQNFIIDGQQRITSLTLLLIYLNNLQRDLPELERVNIQNLIFSDYYGKKSFNLDVPDRNQLMDALFTGQLFAQTETSESVRNIVERYRDIEEIFPDYLKHEALPYFIHWLKGNVNLIEIIAHTDEDAYTIFETMNDRGKPLTSTEMLKGYLLAHITHPDELQTSTEFWKKRVTELKEITGDDDGKFFKTWLRAKYAETIRDRKKGATVKDYEKVGTSFHKWVREEKDRIGLNTSHNFSDFIQKKFGSFSKNYLRIIKASQVYDENQPYLYFNAVNNFTHQYLLLLAPLSPEDTLEVVERKIRLVSGFIDIFIARRVVNFRTLGFSSLEYTMFNIAKEIRGLDINNLAQVLTRKINDMEETFAGMPRFYLHQQNYTYTRNLLARLTFHIEQHSGIASTYEQYITRLVKKPFEIEHILPDTYPRYTDEFHTPEEFRDYRSRAGNLILLPRGFNQSLGSDVYADKVRSYYAQNLLARTLNEQCYTKNPTFLNYIREKGLPFKPYATFGKKEIEERQELYRILCEEIWNPSRFAQELTL